MLRLVFEDRRQAEARGARARRDIETHYSTEAVGHLIRQRLDAIALRRRFSNFKQDMYARYHDYQQLASQLRDVVGAVVPPNATILVISKGDEQLLELGDRSGQHFPQTKDGIYAGYYPADSSQAIAHLENLRAEAADFLLLPNTAFWWLDYYEQFREHLDTHYQRIWDDQLCIIYHLANLRQVER
jgi:hypothetical protein